jgi:hypothetical protein
MWFPHESPLAPVTSARPAPAGRQRRNAFARGAFDTVNKLTAGISSTLALGLLNEAIGDGLPVITVPLPDQMLARHPAFAASIAALKPWGVRLIFDPQRHPLPAPN